VGEGEDLTVGGCDRAVLCGNLSPARAAEQSHAWLAGRGGFDELVRAVRRRVRSNDDRQLVRRVVEGEQISRGALDDARLVVRGDDQGDRGLVVALPDGTSAEAGKNRCGEGIGDLRPHERGKTRPEEDLRDHGAIVDSALDLAAMSSYTRARRPL